MRHLVPDSAPPADRRDQLTLPPQLTSEDPSSFAWGVLHRRHPVLIEQVRAAHPYGPRQNRALDRLAAEATTGAEIQPLDPKTHDFAAWNRWGSGQIGRSWDAAAFLWAESYFYRRLLDALDFFTPGPWYWLDPFAHQKDAELSDPALQAELAALDHLPALEPENRASVLLLAALWGNRADLGFAAHPTDHDETISESLVVDQSSALWDFFPGEDDSICVVADNAGRELLADLVLIDELLYTGRVGQVALHVKPTPYYVSDATTTDVAACLRRLAAAGGYAAAIADRLRAAFASGRLWIYTHWFYAAPLEFREMPAELAAEFSAATLTIFKGDLNYRRVFGDRHWLPTADTSTATAYLPGKHAVLRTLKSEVVLGVPATRVQELDSEHPSWRTSGTHALVQTVGRDE